MKSIPTDNTSKPATEKDASNNDTFINASFASRTALITGGNTGLGYWCAAALLASPYSPPWHVLLACRAEDRGREAVEKLTHAGSAVGRVETMSLDLGSLASVRAFTTKFSARVNSGEIPPLRGLVCNAGVNPGNKRLLTADGLEATFGVNHLGHFLLVNNLMPLLTPPSRVAVVSSGTHDPAQKSGLPAPAWNSPAELSKGVMGRDAAEDKAFTRGQRLYTTSKLANVYFTHALADHLPSGVTANAFDPGLMPGTGLLRNAPAPLRFVGKYILPRAIPLLRRFFSPNVHTAEESGRSLARLLTDPALSGTSGKYFEGEREIRSSDESYNDARATDLWQGSLALTKES